MSEQTSLFGSGLSRTPLPKGFYAGGINSGVRKYRPDLGVILSEQDCVAAGVFTLNQCKAAPVLYSQSVLPSKHIRAIITNSGQANAATGPEGRERNFSMAEATSKAVGCLPHQVLTASTGMIGVSLEIDKINASIPELIDRVEDTAEHFALSILTTDLIPKTATTVVELSGGPVRLTGICKGSGMIHPNMATMLGYLLTDAILTTDEAKKLLTSASDLSFNMISVDGDTSTNDTVFLLANGASGVRLSNERDTTLFKEAMYGLSVTLAKTIARDGEGASKLIEVAIRGAPTLTIAREAARGLTVSPLFKSAIHGEDPNWGRVLAKLGTCGVSEETFQKLSLKIQGHLLFTSGFPAPFDRGEVRKSLKTHTISIEIDLHDGDEKAMAWGCDLSKKYVEINAEYST